MMSRRIYAMAGICVLAVSLSGCYHATVTTGLTPGTQTIEELWATSWVFGLVPPETVDAASQCANGVAIVETELSFLNQVVSAVTFGIFTPMSIKVTCAASSADAGTLNPSFTIPGGALQSEVIETFDRAGNEAAATGDRVVVQFGR